MDESIAAFRKAIRVPEPTPLSRQRPGCGAGNEGRFQEAMKQIRILLGLWPDYPQAHFNLGAIFRQQRNDEQAVACFRQGNRASAELSRGTCRWPTRSPGWGTKQEAIEHLQGLAAELRPQNVDIKFTLAVDRGRVGPDTSPPPLPS